jgi:hypothetical protein
MPSPSELQPGLFFWERRHPDWHPRGFETVGSYALVGDDGTVLVDPLLDDGEADLLDDIVSGPVRILITLPYHTRSAEPIAARYGATIHGHPNVTSRLEDGTSFAPLAPGTALDGVEAFAVGSPPRTELPLHLPAARAIAFGDVVVEHGGALRVWIQEPLTDKRLDWYERRYKPTLARIVDAVPEVERVLVTHGQPVLKDGHAALRAALAAPPWYHGSA